MGLAYGLAAGAATTAAAMPAAASTTAAAWLGGVGAGLIVLVVQVGTAFPVGASASCILHPATGGGLGGAVSCSAAGWVGHCGGGAIGDGLSDVWVRLYRGKAFGLPFAQDGGGVRALGFCAAAAAGTGMATTAAP